MNSKIYLKRVERMDEITGFCEPPAFLGRLGRCYYAHNARRADRRRRQRAEHLADVQRKDAELEEFLQLLDVF